jgi:lipocalin
MYKLERKISSSGVWYDVMLSPFKTRQEVKDYHAKYSRYYPKEDRVYRVTNLETGGMKVIR